ncbi:MAG: flagellar basal body P-ring formation chaperone FlgA [Planctomycetota bacterium]
MHLLATISFLFAALTSGEDPKKAPFELTLKQSVLARGMHVAVGDIADISPANTDSLAIAKLRFGHTPVAGFARAITRSELLQSLVAAGHVAGEFQFKGANEALLQAIVIEVSPTELNETATIALQAVIGLEADCDVEFEVGTKMRAVQAPPGNRSQELRARVRGNSAGINSAVVDVEILVDGESFKTVPITFKLSRFRQVLKTAGTLRQGSPLGPENLVLAREKVAQATGMFLGSIEQVQGMVARRNLASGHLLMLGDVAPPAVIHSGEIVTVILTQGRVKLTMRAIANHDAALGEPLTLTNITSRAQIQGIASAAGTAVVPTDR